MQVIEQTVQVSFRYPVHFTSGLFAPENALLRDLLRAGADGRVPKVLCILDHEVAAHHPALVREVAAYFDAMGDAVDLAAPPLIVEGGEQVKNEPAQVTAIHRAIHEFGIDRHAYIIAIGGGGITPMRSQWEKALSKIEQEGPQMRQQAQGSGQRIQQRAQERKDQIADVREGSTPSATPGYASTQTGRTTGGNGNRS